MPLTETQLLDIRRIYAQRRFANADIQERRLREVYQKLPLVAAIDRKIASLCVAEVKTHLRAEGETPVSASLAPEIKRLSGEKAAALAKAGFPARYLDPVYTCPDCKDTGFIGQKRCHCYTQMARDLLYQKAGLQKSLEKESFSAFSLAYYSPEKTDPETGLTEQEAAASAYETARAFPSLIGTGANLLFYGKTGVGKTFLSHCIAREALHKDYAVLYITAGEFFNSLADAQFHRTEAGLSLSDFVKCDLLILDDLGSELPNTFTAASFFAVINGRLSKGRSTVISTNLNLDQLQERYSERTCSRILSSYTVRPLLGEDIRLRRRLQERSIS